MRSFHAVVPLLCFLCLSAVADLGPYEKLSVGVSYQPLEVRRSDTAEIFTEVAKKDDPLLRARIQYSLTL